MYNKHDISRNAFSLEGDRSRKAFQRWWHTFTGVSLQNGSHKSFYIEFFLCNPDAGKAKAVFARKKGGQEASFLMVKAGTWGENGKQLHRFWGWNKVEVEKGYPFSISAGECFLSESGTHGSIKVTPEEAHDNKDLISDEGEISWSLVFNKKSSLRLANSSYALMRMRSGTSWHAEGMQCDYTGEIRWNGVRYRILPKYGTGYSDVICSRRWASPHIRLSCNNIQSVSENENKRLLDSSLCVFGGAPMGVNNAVIVALKHEGKEYLFDSFNPFTFTRCKVDCKEKRYKVSWDIEIRGIRSKMKIELSCPKNLMQKMRYSATGGPIISRLWSGALGSGTLTLQIIGQKDIQLQLKECFCEYGVSEGRRKKVNLQDNNTTKE